MVIEKISRRTQGAFNMKFELYKDAKNEWRWTPLARNGRIIGDSGEGYKRKGKCKRMIERIVIGVQSAKITE